MATRTLPDRERESAPAERPSALGGALLWGGTVAYGGSTVALLAVLSRHSGKTGFSAVAALLGLSFVVSLIPAGLMLRSASLVVDGRPPPALNFQAGCLVAAVALVLSVPLALLLHVAVAAAAIVMIQMLVAIPLAIRQGALLGRHRFDALGLNLVIEGIARFALGAVGGIAFGVIGVALGLCAGTAVALLVLPGWSSEVTLVDRPRTSLTAASLSLALLGLFVQLDVLIAPSVVAGNGAATYDLAAVPSKGVYLALLALGPLLFPSVRGRPDRRIIAGAALGALGVGLACTGALVVGRHLIGALLGRAAADPLELALLGVAMALAGVTGIAISAGIARGLPQPWPPLALGIVLLLVCWPLRPGVLGFSIVVVICQAVVSISCLANCFKGVRRMPTEDEDVMELFAEAGDPLVPAQAAASLPAVEPGHRVFDSSSTRNGDVAVVIPTFRRPELLRRLVETVRSGNRVPDEIVVVDNDPERSVDPLDLPPGVQVVYGGFGMNVAAARNAGWRASKADVCIFIDDDNEVDEGCIGALVSACLDERVGIAGPVIYSGDEGTIWCASLAFSRWTGLTRCVGIGETEPPDPGPRWPTAGMPDAFALRRDVLERVNGLDEIVFPFCGEEFDLNRRVGALGLERIVVRDAHVRHYGNVSEDPGEQLVRGTMHHGPQRARIMARARVRLHRRHSQGLARWSTLVLFVPLWACASALLCLKVKAPLRARLQTVRAIASGMLEGYREVAA
ncbi:MAG TPA: glycosyltransferase [Acidimicrobiales bacterium]|nr:glycosyltransferase [Acidimicrobiales bacterium]